MGTMKHLMDYFQWIPSKWQRVARWVLGSMGLVMVLLVMAWSALHIFIVPRIESYRVQIEQQVSRALKQSLQIGSLDVQGGWWVPVIAAKDIALIDSEGRSLMQLQRVQATLSLRSVLMGQLEKLELEGLQLAAHRATDGHIWVAGVDTSVGGSGGGADWFFSLPEFVLREGTLRWHDETLQASPAPVLTLNPIDVAIQNSWFHHAIRLAIAPPASIADPIKLQGNFRQLPWQRAGNTKQWSGTLLGEMPRLDLKHLSPWLPSTGGFELQDAQGGLKLQLELDPGRLASVSTDLRFSKFDARLKTGLPSLSLRDIKGRLGLAWSDKQIEFSSQDLVFDTADHDHWPGGEMRFAWRPANFESGTFKADRIDLQAVGQIAQRLALPDTIRSALARMRPTGKVNQSKGSWQLPNEADVAQSILRYSARGTVNDLGWSQDTNPNSAFARIPGIQGVTLDFDVTQQGGQVQLDIHKGRLTLPPVFEEPKLDIQLAKVKVDWQIKDKDIAVQIKRSHIDTSHFNLAFNGDWKTANGDDKFPGVLDLTADINQLKVNQVNRFLPTTLSPGLRNYLIGAFQGGDLNKIQMRVRGHLKDMPFADPTLGEFRVSAQMANVKYAYVPPKPGQVPWPAVTEMNGELVLDRQSLKINGTTKMVGAPRVLWRDVDIQIPTFADPVVLVKGHAQGPVQDVLDMVTSSALNNVTGKALETSHAEGNGRYRLDITVPLKNASNTKVIGQIGFDNNSFQLSKSTPRLTHLRGEVEFGGPALKVNHVRAALLGGELHANGELASKTAPVVEGQRIEISGHLTAEGLRQASELGAVSHMAQRMSGDAQFSANLQMKQGRFEASFNGDLKAMGLNLPAPLVKTAGAPMAIRADIKPTEIKASFGQLMGVHFVHDLTGATPKVLRGLIAVGDPLRDNVVAQGQGVAMNIRLAELDVDAWSEAMSGPPSKTATSATAVPSTSTPSAASPESPYLPSKFSIRVDRLKASQREFHGLNLVGNRQAAGVNLKVNGQEVSGAVDVRWPQSQEPLQINARLAYLHVPASNDKVAEKEVPKKEKKEDITSLPNLSVVVEDLKLSDMKLGRFEINAVNQKASAKAESVWRLNALKLSSPEMTLSVTGDWTSRHSAKSTQSATHLNFSVDANDTGRLLESLQLKGVMTEGETHIKGDLSWPGSPAYFEKADMAGKVNVSVAKGMIVKVEPGAGRLLGVLNLESLPRRLRLDFSDLFADGLAFDTIEGDLTIGKGQVQTQNLKVEGVIATAQIEGGADLVQQTQDLKVTVIPHINLGTSSVYLATINPWVGLTNFVTQYLVTTPINKLTTTEIRVDGTWSKPQVTKVN